MTIQEEPQNRSFCNLPASNTRECCFTCLTVPSLLMGKYCYFNYSLRNGCFFWLRCFFIKKKNCAQILSQAIFLQQRHFVCVCVCVCMMKCLNRSTWRRRNLNLGDTPLMSRMIFQHNSFISELDDFLLPARPVSISCKVNCFAEWV